MGQNGMTVEQENTIRSSVVLSNAGELGASIIKEIAGNDISNAINGSRVSDEIVQSLIHRRIAERVASKQRAA